MAAGEKQPVSFGPDGRSLTPPSFLQRAITSLIPNSIKEDLAYWEKRRASQTYVKILNDNYRRGELSSKELIGAFNTRVVEERGLDVEVTKGLLLQRVIFDPHFPRVIFSPPTKDLR